MGRSLALLLVLAAAMSSPASAAAFNVTYLSARRFPIEAVGTPATIEACTTPPLPAPSGTNLYVSLGQPGNALTFPGFRVGGQLVGGSNLPVKPNGTAGCFTITPGKMAGAGPGLLEIVSNGTGTNRAKVEYYESVSMTFGLRPYITETEGTLLLRPDGQIIAMTAAAAAAATAGSAGSSPVSVQMDLPFATPPRKVTWSAAQGDIKLLQKWEHALSFSLSGLPVTVNQDVKITVTLPDNCTFTKWRRLMRAPRLPRNSSVLAVQVDHSTKSLLVDGRLWAGSGFYYGGGYEHRTSSFPNFTEFVARSAVPKRLNAGMIYRLHLYTPEEQLNMMDQLASVGFKVLYEMPQMDNCNGSAVPDEETSCELHHDQSSPGYQLLNSTVQLIKDHPALLGYYICDDCCKSNRGATLMAQAYNIIHSMDPYHIITGASDCPSTWVFSDGHASCLKWAGEVNYPSGPGPANCGVEGCVCKQPSTTNTSRAVIPYGDQPKQQLSLDYILQENYEGGLWRHSGDGHWKQGFIGPDGENHAANPFEPIVNCPSRAGSPGDGQQWLYSQAWLGAIQSAMYDFIIFTGPAGDTASAATIAKHFQELRPGFWRRFGGNAPTASVSVEESLPGAGCFDQRSPPPPPDPEGWRNPYWPDGRLRARVFAEEPVAADRQVCAHLVVVNLQLDAATAFSASLGGNAFGGSFVNLTAARMFVNGPTLAVSAAGTVEDWIGPGATNIYRLGNCTPPLAQHTELATPPVSTHHAGGEGFVYDAVPGAGWGQGVSGVYTAEDDPRVSAVTDTTVALAPSRHSLRINLPSGAPVVIALPGKQLVPPSTASWCMMVWHCKAAVPGKQVVGSSATLPAGKSYRVSISVQTSPCGTAVEIMNGSWTVMSAVTREAMQAVTAVYHGSPLVQTTSCGGNWTTIEAVVNGSAHTALQLRLTAPQTDRNWGGAVWIGAASIVEHQYSDAV